MKQVGCESWSQQPRESSPGLGWRMLSGDRQTAGLCCINSPMAATGRGRGGYVLFVGDGQDHPKLISTRRVDPVILRGQPIKLDCLQSGSCLPQIHAVGLSKIVFRTGVSFAINPANRPQGLALRYDYRLTGLHE